MYWIIFGSITAVQELYTVLEALINNLILIYALKSWANLYSNLLYKLSHVLKGIN